eukprot:759-Heterococcus_DN1.PRE.1
MTDSGGGGITHSSSYSSNASASGYTSSPVLSRYPIPQQIHRVGVDCDNANSSSHNSTADHDFYPPIPLDCDGTSTAERLLRSQFVSPSAGTAANSSSNSGASSSAKGDVMKRVRYGDFIRLWASSAYTHKGGYVGSLRRVMRRRNAVGKGELYVIPYVPSDSNGTSAQPSPSIVFHEACFKIIDPQCEKEDGDILLFGDEISFVDERGFVINNKDGRLHGRLGPSLFGNGGHMHFSILQQQQQQSAAAATVTHSTVTTIPPPLPPAQRGASDDALLTNSPVKSFSSVLSSSSLGSPTVSHSTANNSTTTSTAAAAASSSMASSTRPAVCYGDACVMVAKKVRPKREGVTRAHVTHFRRRQQRYVTLLAVALSGCTLCKCMLKRLRMYAQVYCCIRCPVTAALQCSLLLVMDCT